MRPMRQFVGINFCRHWRRRRRPGERNVPQQIICNGRWHAGWFRSARRGAVVNDQLLVMAPAQRGNRGRLGLWKRWNKELLVRGLHDEVLSI